MYSAAKHGGNNTRVEGLMSVQDICLRIGLSDPDESLPTHNISGFCEKEKETDVNLTENN